MKILKVCCGLFFCLLTLVFLAIIGISGFIYTKKDSPRFKGALPIITSEDSWKYHFEDIPDLNGKIAIITGANVGLGFFTAKHLAMKKATTILACRNMKKCNAAVTSIKAIIPLSKVIALPLDLSSLKSVKQFIEKFRQEYTQLDILILNAGVMSNPYTLSVDGLELQFAVNHLAHHYLATRLLPELEKSPFSTVVSVSSGSHFNTYGDVELTVKRLNDKELYHSQLAYGQSKLYNILFAQEFAKRVGEKSIYVNSIHPGVVRTEIARHVLKIVDDKFGKNAVEILDRIFSSLLWSSNTAALTQLYAATSPEIQQNNIRGKYFVPIAQLGVTSEETKDKNLQINLWELTERLISVAEGNEECDAYVSG